MGAEGNRKSWNEGAAVYSAFNHSEKMMQRIAADPANAFHSTVWEVLNTYMPSLAGKRVCVPSSGDNHAVFAFAMMGAEVTSCDIAENQLENARRVAQQHGWDKSITFVRADTMQLAGIADGAYDLVYTSNGVHVWIDDLPAMYRSIHRIMKRGAMYIMYEIHPFLRPFNSAMQVVKPYDSTGPFVEGDETTFGWRVMDIMGALLGSGLALRQIEEMFDEKDYDWPFFLSYEEIARGVRAAPEEVDRMYDWRNNPMAALPNWLCLAAQKPA